MTEWPVSPCAEMHVRNYHFGTSSRVKVSESQPRTQVVSDVNIEFVIDVDFDDHPLIDNGKGYFSATLYVLNSDGNWVEIDETNHVCSRLTLGDGTHDGFYEGKLRVNARMQNEIEQYRLCLTCKTTETSFPSSAEQEVVFSAIQDSNYVGNFTMDFLPLSIIYCPPYKMEGNCNSLEESLDFGTRLTIGSDSRFIAQRSVHVRVAGNGVEIGGFSVSNSQRITNSSSVGINISHFRKNVTTACSSLIEHPDYCGPLSDLFVILVNPEFQLNQRIDGTLFYVAQDIRQIIVAPAHRLLRPGDDQITRAIPSKDRRRLVALDPFIRNIDLFFDIERLFIEFNCYHPSGNWSLNEAFKPPDWGIGEHVTPSKNGFYKLHYTIRNLDSHTPSAQPRRVIVEFKSVEIIKLGLYGHSSTIDVDFEPVINAHYCGRRKAQIGVGSVITLNLSMEVTVKADPSLNIKVAANPFIDPSHDNRAECIGRYWLDKGAKFAYSRGEAKELYSRETSEFEWETTLRMTSAGFGFSLMGLLGFSLSTENTYTTSVGIQRSYETEVGKSKSAFCCLAKDQNEVFDGVEIYYDKLFSTLMFRQIMPAGYVAGRAAQSNGVWLGNLNVVLRSDSGLKYSTVTDRMGNFQFSNLESGEYVLSVGDQSKRIVVESNKRVTQNFSNVKWVVDLEKASVWEVMKALNISSDKARLLGAELSKIATINDVARLCKLSDSELEKTLENTIVRFPGYALHHIDSIKEAEREKLEKHDIRSITDLLEALSTPASRENISRLTSIDNTKLLELANMCELMHISGISENHFKLLKQVGKDTVDKLKEADLSVLHKEIERVNKIKKILPEAPSVEEVKALIDSCKKIKSVIIA